MGTDDEILIALDEGRNLLDKDNVPNRNQSLHCFACEAPMVGLYCHRCGNKNDNYRRSVWSLGVELFQNLTAFDGRMFRSLKSLILEPGQMSRDFSDGARSRWTSPIRFYIATSLLLFGYITVSQTQILAIGAVTEAEAEPLSINKGSTGESTFSPRPLFFIQKARIIQVQNQQSIDKNAEEFLRAFRPDPASDVTESVDPAEGLAAAIEELNADIAVSTIQAERTMLIRTRDAIQARLDPMAADATDATGTDAGTATDREKTATDTRSNGSDEGLNFTRVNGQQVSLNGDVLRELYRMVLKQPEIINTQVNNDLKLAMFFMMPFAMLMGALFIRGRDSAMFYDHLVHAAYVHSFSFILLFVFILLHQYTGLPTLLIVYTLILLIYLPLSTKRMFGRGWFKSFLTAYGVGAVYTLVMLLVFCGIVVLALQNLAGELSEQQARFASTTASLSVPTETTETSATPDRP